MALYLIAEFTVELQNHYPYLERQCVEYICKGTSPVDFTIRITQQELAQECHTSNGAYSVGYLESVCAYSSLARQLPYRDALLLHASVISCQGRGIAFVARSGVGKTTHTMLWKEGFPMDVKIINGDKPIVRFVDNMPYAYGTPWAGKENYQCNECVLLTDICLLERSENNAIERASTDECLDMLMQQVLHCEEPSAELKTLEMVDRLLSGCNLWSIRCNASLEAAEMAYNQIMREVCNETKI